MSTEAIVVFDGVCHLCNGWVRFLLRCDHRAQFRFAALQSNHGRRLLAAHGLDPDNPSSLLLLVEGRALTDTAAIIEVLTRLGGGWRLARLGSWIPSGIRDPLYRWVARHRYRLFGRRESCALPDPAWQDRFLADPPLAQLAAAPPSEAASSSATMKSSA